MSSRWQRTFEVSIPVERLWQAFRDDREYGRLLAWPDASVEQAADKTRRQVVHAEPMKLLKFESRGSAAPDRAEFTVVFESTETGSRFTVTRYGFGEGDAADVFGESNWLGCCHGYMDLVFYLETGQPAKRHYLGCAQSCTGMMYKQRDWGIEVLDVTPRSFADEAGLARGDRIVRIGTLPIFTRSDIWGLVTVHGPGTEFIVEYVRGRERRRGQGRLSDLALAAWGE
jgi:hypothetical protein